MSYFKNMDQPESNDITKHPGYASLPEAEQRKVNDHYVAVYNANQRMGVKISQGMAFEAAKQMCEGLGPIVNGKQKPITPYAGSWADQEAKRDKSNVHPLAKPMYPGATTLPGKYDAKGNKMAEEEEDAPGATYEAEDDDVMAAIADPLKRGPKDYGVTKQAQVPQAHPVDMDWLANAPPPASPHHDPHRDDDDGMAQPSGDTDDPEDDNGKAIQKKNHSMKEGKNHTFDDIEHGDSVSYKTPQGQISSGTAHLHGGDSGNHWVLRNSSKSGGTGSIVSPKNFHSVTKRGKKLSSSKSFLVYGAGGKPSKNEEVDPLIAASLNYINYRAEVAGIMESTDDLHTELAGHLKTNHGMNKNGVLTTDYTKIPGLKVKASTTNGTSGTGHYKGKNVHWAHHHPTGKFNVTNG